jgi:hypothetical protein
MKMFLLPMPIMRRFEVKAFCSTVLVLELFTSHFADAELAAGTAEAAPAVRQQQLSPSCQQQQLSHSTPGQQQREKQGKKYVLFLICKALAWIFLS